MKTKGMLLFAGSLTVLLAVQPAGFAQQLQVKSNNGTQPANLSTTKAEFCVGQSLTFTLCWDPTTPPYTNIDVRWSLPAKYVNQPINYSSTCATYVHNDDLLTNLSQQCWYVRDPGGTAKVAMNLHFSNGQNVGLTTRGDFTIYRPSIFRFENSENGFSKTLTGLKGHMHWFAWVDSKYSGYIGVTQIISCNNESSDYYTAGYNLLDGDSEIYGEPPDDGSDNSGPKQYIPGNPRTYWTEFEDWPWDPFAPCANMIANFKDYIRFQPDGGIFVTLGTVDWHMNGNACLIGGISPNDLPPASQPADSDAFPTWELIRHGK